MKTKTAYRPKNIPTEEPSNIPEEPPQPSETTRVEFTNGADKAEPSVAIVSADEFPAVDEATLALQKQLADLRKSEQMQREFAQQVAAQRAAQAAPAPTLPAEPEARIALWKQAGLSDSDAAYLQERPQMVEFPMVTRAAYAATLQSGVERDSSAFAETMEGNFAALLNQAQARPAATDPAGFFQPPPQPAHSRPDPASYVSAPVSRGVPSGETGYRPARQIKLTPQEQEFARIAGISDVEFAKQKQKLILAKANGDYGERR